MIRRSYGWWSRDNPPRTTAPESHWVRNTTLVAAVVSGLAYLLGFLYLTGYYHRLGVEETELDFDGIFVRMQSMGALLYPVFWLAMIAVFTLLLAPRDGNWTWLKRPFYPVPTIRVLAVVYTLWAVKVLGEILYGRDETIWYAAYRRRDILIFLFGLLALAIQYSRAWHVGHRLWGKWLTRRTVAQLSTFIWITVILVGSWALKHSWPLKDWQSALLALGWAIMIYDVARDIRKRKDRSEEAPSEFDSNPSPSEMVLLGAWVILLVLLTAGLAGNLDASRLEDGCNARKTIVFEPMPEPLLRNHTYWLVLHQHGNYYLRDITANATAINYIVPENSQRIAILGNAPTKAC